MIVGGGEGAEQALGRSAGRRWYEGVSLTRELVTEPANIIYPESFVERVRASLEGSGLEIEVLDRAAMEKLGMGALLGVAQGSVREARLLVLRWNGGGKGEAPVAFVGKGVTFDTGGISIKPAAGMEAMKWDMGGAGAVVGAMKALALRKAKANVVGICGLVENMPDGNAQRPGDVVTTMSGQTVEVINTDAEGRLVLCDAITYVQRNYKPTTIIDLATLTGAMVISLGHEWAGLFSNNDELAAELIKRRRRVRRQIVADAAGGAVRPADRFADRRHEECRPARRRIDHRRAVHPALRRERRRLGAHRHGRHGLVGQGRADLRQGRDRLRRAPARPISSRTCSRAEPRRGQCGSISTSSAADAAGAVIASLAEKSARRRTGGC